MTAQTVPGNCLALPSALISPACPLTGTVFEVTTEGLSRKIFTFAAVLTDLIFAIWMILNVFVGRNEGKSLTCVTFRRMDFARLRFRAVEHIRGIVVAHS